MQGGIPVEMPLTTTTLRPMLNLSLNRFLLSPLPTPKTPIMQGDDSEKSLGLSRLYERWEPFDDNCGCVCIREEGCPCISMDDHRCKNPKPKESVPMPEHWLSEAQEQSSVSPGGAMQGGDQASIEIRQLRELMALCEGLGTCPWDTDDYDGPEELKSCCEWGGASLEFCRWCHGPPNDEDLSRYTNWLKFTTRPTISPPSQDPPPQDPILNGGGQSFRQIVPPPPCCKATTLPDCRP